MKGPSFTKAETRLAENTLREAGGLSMWRASHMENFIASSISMSARRRQFTSAREPAL